MQPWYMYPISVPFGDPNYDSALGGAHDLDVGAPPNYPVTALLPGFIASITAPAWGRQVGIKLDIPYNGVPCCAFLHLSAVSPALSVGKHVSADDLIGWVGGANTASQYNGTSNPTGQNFLNPPFQSSRVQVGFALMRGTEYGMAGWENFPPVDWALNPTPIIDAARKAYRAVNEYQQAEMAAVWTQTKDLPQFAGTPPRTGTGIYNDWIRGYLMNHRFGSPTSNEYDLKDFDGNAMVAQNFENALCYWRNNAPHWYDGHGAIVF